MMNEVACYLYAYRARWLATGSAKGSGSKWNSAAGQYIIKRNVCTWNLHAFSRCGQGCLTGFGGGGGSENGGEGGIKRQVGVGEERMFCWMSGEQAKGGCRFLLNQFYFRTGWSVSFNHFTAAGKWKVPGLISQLELTEQPPPPPPVGLQETVLSLLCHYELRQRNSGKALVCKEGKKSSTFWRKSAKSHLLSLYDSCLGCRSFCASKVTDIPLQTCSVPMSQDPSVMCLQLVQK